jgi:hypothetical protein
MRVAFIAASILVIKLMLVVVMIVEIRSSILIDDGWGFLILVRNEEVFDIRAATVITYILAVALGCYLPTWIVGAGDHRGLQVDIFQLLKYNGVVFMLEKEVGSKWILSSILMQWRADDRGESTLAHGHIISRCLMVMTGVKLDAQIANQLRLIKHEDVILSIKMCRPLLELTVATEKHIILE